uniref:Uncharacterized protein n=1 Tax=Rhizophora mucronata TaxID=61149 RepID=A0A2P2Q6Y8_RHIMU
MMAWILCDGQENEAPGAAILACKQQSI